MERKKSHFCSNLITIDSLWTLNCETNYIFGSMLDKLGKSKYDEINTKPLLSANPGFKLYVTGHSLVRVAQLCANIPIPPHLSTFNMIKGSCVVEYRFFLFGLRWFHSKPVTCINFASPCVGNSMYLKASSALEVTKKIRFLCVVNDKDTFAVMPMFNYQHAGFQIWLNQDTSVWVFIFI